MFSKQAMKAQQLQAMFARKRELEHQHMERTQAVQKYYDHWGKVTQRYENWCTPKYYKQAEEKLQHSKEQKEKQKTMEARKTKLRQLLNDEKENYNLEIKEKSKARITRAHHNTSMLEKINARIKEEKDIKRKLELEAKLYGKWRHGVDDDKLLFDSKTDNEALAKLNWLDKQMQDQLEKEKEEEMAKERELRLQEELNRAEQLHKERQQIREQEIREIRALQESHMEQLKERQEESSQLKQEEEKYRICLENLDKELELLNESYKGLQQPADYGGAYNLTKIKLFMRKRSEIYRNHINMCISIVDRCLAEAQKPDYLKVLKDKFIRQLDSEIYQLSLIDAMYESEAKYKLQKCEELWKLQGRDCYNDLKDILSSEHIHKRKLLNDVLTKQDELIDIRSAHLNAIENTSEKLKQLIKEEENSPRPSNNLNDRIISPRQHGGANESDIMSPRLRRETSNKKTVTFSSTPSPRGSQGSAQSTTSAPESNSSYLNQPPPARESHRSKGLYNHTNDPSTDSNHLTKSFSNLNLNGWEDNADSKRPVQESQGSTLSSKPAPESNSSYLNQPPPARESHRSKGLYNHTSDPSSDSNHLTKSFSNLNLNAWNNNTDTMRQAPSSASRSVRYLPTSNSSYLNVPPPARESHRSKGLYNRNYEPSTDPFHLTKSFSNLNLNGWENDTDSKRDTANTDRLGGIRSLQDFRNDNVEKPRFGRKRVAWT